MASLELALLQVLVINLGIHLRIFILVIRGLELAIRNICCSRNNKLIALCLDLITIWY